MVILDVREKDEFEAENIPNSICCPLSQFDLLAPGILKTIKDQEVLVMCRSGNRAKLAMNELKKFDVDQHNFKVYEGGILKWKSEGQEVQGPGSIFPIMRQVQIVAGAIALTGFFGGKYLGENFFYLTLLVGFGLSLAGWTGFCPMAFILQKMPWNKVNNKSGACCN